MARGATRALIVDDTEPMLLLLEEHLESNGFETVPARDGVEAWDVLQRETLAIDVVLLDRMMPNMDGMEVMARMKAHPVLCDIPVIMQTAVTGREAIVEGIQAGVYYYLTKPFDLNLMLSITRAAVADNTRRRRLQDEVRKRASGIGLMVSGTFRLRTLDEANNLAVTLAAACPQSREAVIGLSELLINAVEHGNLGIGYDGKTQLIASGEWRQEVSERLSRPDEQSRFVTVDVERGATEIAFTVTDQGEGFDWRRYLEMDPERAFDSHGRGIALARQISFQSLEYRGRGNQVVATVALPADGPQSGAG